MTIFDWFDRRVKLMNWMDIGLLKICVAAFVLMLASAWPALLAPGWQVFAVIFVVTYVPLFIKLVIARQGSDGNA